ncbi:phosphatase PAP2 family protein [Bordetella genomosp. 5]|uniref:Phosphatidic acid phosphatase type 2/haloperoxidase domain-containing protein n=1 Tax=Bordetella genomosp. 5 TaxID=1395608 RepID=A0A261TLN9_9BORD|nr:phosphatase PAP2 family protein [Bordetella genomosp. 5]OZI50157.1 hypothetical protein CAL25_12555 [Bordetella genomosp. 5]
MSVTPLPVSVPVRRSWITSYRRGHVVLVPLLLALLACWVQQSGLDAYVAHRLYDADQARFALQQAPVLDAIGHQALRAIPALLAAAALFLLAAGFVRPALKRWRGLALALLAAMALSPLCVAMLKQLTALPRPYALSEFGGTLAWPAQFWAGAGQPAGHALPSHHAASGFAVGLLYFFGWAAGKPRLRWGGLIAGVLLGSLFAALRIGQGAHFLSQTCWSAVVVWTVGALCFWPLLRRDGRTTNA